MLGQLYLILYNMPIKDFSKVNFTNLFNSFIYIFPFIGLRYSPRIVFSCSGFSLSLKYISYIKAQHRNYFLKFIFRQLYKYLMLILLLLFMRYSYYYCQAIISLEPIMEIFNMSVLNQPEKSYRFLSSLFFIESFIWNKLEGNAKHYLSDFYWMAFNEIFFFFCGTVLISIGYKYRLKIDYVIIILVTLLYFIKIFSFSIYNAAHTEEKYYTTLYYYMFDYGEVMMNPLFNLNYYLIGMYFGLINYNFEFGITGYKENFYKKIHDNMNNKEEEFLINAEKREYLLRNENKNVDDYKIEMPLIKEINDAEDEDILIKLEKKIQIMVMIMIIKNMMKS